MTDIPGWLSPPAPPDLPGRWVRPMTEAAEREEREERERANLERSETQKKRNQRKAEIKRQRYLQDPQWREQENAKRRARDRLPPDVKRQRILEARKKAAETRSRLAAERRKNERLAFWNAA